MVTSQGYNLKLCTELVLRTLNPLSLHPPFNTPFSQGTVPSHGMEGDSFSSNRASSYHEGGTTAEVDTSSDASLDTILYHGSCFDGQHYDASRPDDNVGTGASDYL